MTLKDILKRQRYQRYKSLIFLVSLENSDFSKIKEVFEKEEYELINIYDEIQNEKLDLKKFVVKKLDYLKEFFNSKNISGKIMIVENLEILLSMLDEEEFKNFLNKLTFDNYTDVEKKQSIFLLPDVFKYRAIGIKNEDDGTSRVYKIETIEI